MGFRMVGLQTVDLRTADLLQVGLQTVDLRTADLLQAGLQTVDPQLVDLQGRPKQDVSLQNEPCRARRRWWGQLPQYQPPQ